VQRGPMARLLVTADSSKVVPEELYDLQGDPGERSNLASSEPERAAALRAQLERALARGGASAEVAEAQRPAGAKVHLRLAGGGQARDAELVVRLVEKRGGPTRSAGSLRATAVGFAADRLAASGEREVRASFALPAGALAGLELEIDPPDAAVSWEIHLGGAALPAARAFAGAHGLAAPELAGGLFDADDRAVASSASPPFIDARRDEGLFVSLDPLEEPGVAPGAAGQESMREVERLLEAWGYASPASSK
jgi:hypothetical protein